MSEENFVVITGASGAGKSTLLTALNARGHSTVEEAALAVLREQQQRDGGILPGVDRAAFLEEVLARNIQNHRSALGLPKPVFLDRGIPECLAWLRLAGVDLAPRHLDAPARYRYAPTVFVAEPWPEVYVQTDDRLASFERASRSFEPTVAAYAEAGYTLCVIPKVTVEERVEFMLSRVGLARASSGFESPVQP